MFTNGCFDLFHPGHLACLQFAKRQGDVLVVAVDADNNVRQLKGSNRPIIKQGDRAEMLAALECVDHVVVFDTHSVSELLDIFRPDVYVKGGTSVIEESVQCQCKQNGCRVMLSETVEGMSTTSLITKDSKTNTRDAVCLAEVHRIVHDDMYQIRPLFGHRLPV